MERNASHFRHHALAHRRMAPHSGEDAGQAFKSVEDHMMHGGSTYAQRQARRTKRGLKKFSDFITDARDDPATEQALQATEAAMLIGAGKKDMFQELGSSHFWKHVPQSASCRLGFTKKNCAQQQR